ncbi:MAG: NAD(P)/FAD-dependent oxidoreductase [Rhodococcus sp. (in: high G+C Gram-positive bacteria)]|uniref:NAD(P)/FAD-dependent oxidoreductase n=1 Tax=Rhodococcus sp. TaxID=1831 RepID=UPI003BB16A58
MYDYVTDVDLLLVGAGPVGLYGAYCAGFRGLSVAIMDPLPHAGGQVSALYPEKNIYDIAGFPAIKGQELIDNLLLQADRFSPTYLLGHEAAEISRTEDGILVTTTSGAGIRTKAVIVTAGAGAASPRQLPCGEAYLDRGLHYFVPSLSLFDNKDVVVVGGGDSAVDWALAATERARSVALVHRRKDFRAHEHSVRLLRESDCEFVLGAQVTGLRGEKGVESVVLEIAGEPHSRELEAQVVVAALGFKLRLGPIAEWGLRLHDRAVLVDAAMHTNLDGVYAAGDIASHPGKVKLISVGFGEVATAVNNAAAYIRPTLGLSPGHSSDAVSLVPAS